MTSLTIRNRIWFALHNGSHTNSVLQGAWNSHGCDCFTFEALERLDEEALSYVRDRRLRERLAHWRALRGRGRVRLSKAAFQVGPASAQPRDMPF